LGALMATLQKCSSKAHATGIGAVRSSTEHSREAALKLRVAELEKQVQAFDHFLAMATHELRNLITPISAQLELLLVKTPDSGGGSAPFVQGLNRLEQLVDAYLRRTTLLLEVSRIRSGSLRLHIAEVNLSELVREVTGRMMPLAERAGCSVRLTVEDGVIGRCDAMAMEQVLENLVSNAVRYGPGGPVEIALSGDGLVGRLSVRDEGIGIPEHDQSKIFEPFHTARQIDRTGGFGVGLWVTRRLVTAMQGEIAVSSGPGSGSTFTVRLPLSAGERDGH
jgi:two-component system, OmpR family, sensor kinase